ncbi:MarR family winged helix-turn-helix transcriptional regulator [Kribbella sp. NPDC051587]|uniref:MarR family winged helix-turn-helix transcriptional regulator n=1 Tax=Kribbella sp. NPDC051587 TaxID=3364119 RepID=UPI0037A7C983
MGSSSEVPVLWELVRTARIAERWLAQAVGSAELTPTQFAVVACLGDTGELSKTELARSLRVRHQVMGPILRRMIDAGLVELTGLGGRGRRNVLRLTQAGHDALGHAQTAVVRASRPTSLGLTAREQVTLTRLLVQLRDALDDAELAQPTTRRNLQ